MRIGFRLAMAQPVLPQYAGYPPLQDATKAEDDLPPIKEHWSRRKHQTAVGSFRIRGLFALKFIKYWVLLVLLLVVHAMLPRDRLTPAGCCAFH